MIWRLCESLASTQSHHCSKQLGTCNLVAELRNHCLLMRNQTIIQEISMVQIIYSIFKDPTNNFNDLYLVETIFHV